MRRVPWLLVLTNLTVMSNRITKSSNKPRGRKIAEADWNKHRDRILHLYLDDGGEGRTVHEIVEVMKRECNFVAT